MNTLQSAIALTQSGSKPASMGSPNTVYVSIPDPQATTTSGSNCASLSLPVLPAGYAYHCSGPSYYQKTDGTGWIPINFSSVTPPLGTLPIDPINTALSRLYYTYTTTGSQYETTAVMESPEYKLGGMNDVIAQDGGTLATVYEKGTKLGLEPLDYGDPSLVGYWTFDEGTGTAAYDYSGANATGSLGSPAPTWTTGKVGGGALSFNGTDNTVTVPDYSAIDSSPAPFSYSLWFNSSSVSTLQGLLGKSSHGGYPTIGGIVGLAGARLYCQIGHNGYYGNTTLSNNTWYHQVLVWDGTELYYYLNGKSDNTPIAAAVAPFNVPAPLTIGNWYSTGGDFFTGLIDDVRVYNRALSAAEIQAMYNGGK